MTNEPLVTILMNCYNGEKYLKDSLNSLISQSYKNWELIFWDNQSNDRSKKIFDTFNDARLKYYKAQNHEKLYVARNQALSKAKGEYIAFLDVDDLWEPKKLEKQIKLFEDQEVGLVYGNLWRLYNYPIFFKKKHVKKNLLRGFIFDNLLEDDFIGLSTIVLRKKYLKNFPNIFDEKYNMLSDYDFILRFSKEVKFDFVNEPVSTYRIHKNNMSKKYLEEHVTQMNEWIKERSEKNFFSSDTQIDKLKSHLEYLKIKLMIKKSRFIPTVRKIMEYPNFLIKIKLFIFLFFRKYFI